MVDERALAQDECDGRNARRRGEPCVVPDCYVGSLSVASWRGGWLIVDDELTQSANDNRIVMLLVARNVWKDGQSVCDYLDLTRHGKVCGVKQIDGNITLLVRWRGQVGEFSAMPEHLFKVAKQTA